MSTFSLELLQNRNVSFGVIKIAENLECDSFFAVVIVYKLVQTNVSFVLFCDKKCLREFAATFGDFGELSLCNELVLFPQH